MTCDAVDEPFASFLVAVRDVNEPKDVSLSLSERKKNGLHAQMFRICARNKEFCGFYTVEGGWHGCKSRFILVQYKEKCSSLKEDRFKNI